MDEGILGCMGIILAIAVAVAILGAIGIGISFVGMTIIIAIDFIARSMTVAGVGHPAIGWLVLGFLIGATIGLAQGLTRAGRKSARPIVYSCGVGVIVILIIVSASTSIPPTIAQVSQNQPLPPPCQNATIVNALNINLRREPDGDVLAVLPSGTRVCVMEWRGTWARVKILGAPPPNAQNGGWVGSKFIRPD